MVPNMDILCQNMKEEFGLQAKLIDRLTGREYNISDFFSNSVDIKSSFRKKHMVLGNN